MKKLRFEKGSDAVHRSAQAAESKGADMTSGGTQLRWTVGKDATGHYLDIPEDENYLLTQEEIERLE